MPSRRVFLRATGITGAALALPGSRYGAPGRPSRARPFQVPLAIPPVMTPVRRAVSKDLDRNRWVINGKPFDAGRVDVEPQLGDTEVWTFVNRSPMVHPMHLHLVKFQVLERRNAALTPTDLGWKDTVRVDASSPAVRIIMRFDGFAGRYMFHCHNMALEDHSMMAQMLVRRSDGAVESPSFEGGYVGGVDRRALGYRCELPR